MLRMKTLSQVVLSQSHMEKIIAPQNSIKQAFDVSLVILKNSNSKQYHLRGAKPKNRILHEKVVLSQSHMEKDSSTLPNSTHHPMSKNHA